jgi:hypothetical protein
MRPLFMTTVLAIGAGIISAAHLSAQPIEAPTDGDAVSSSPLVSPADYYVYRYRDEDPPYRYVERPTRYRYLYRDDDRPYRYRYVERPYRYRYVYRDDDRPYRYRYVERPYRDRYVCRDDDRPYRNRYVERPYRAYRRSYWYRYDD